MDVIGFGAVNLDETYSIRALSALPELAIAPGSEQMVDAGRYDKLSRLLEKEGAPRLLSGGGQAANTLYALSALGGFASGIISSVGTDREGDYLLADLAPVDTSQVARGGRTARCIVIVEEGGERAIRVLPAANPPALDPVSAWVALGGAPYLHLTSLAPPDRLSSQVKLIESIPDIVRVSLDPGEIYCRLGIEVLTPLLKRSYVVFLGEREIEILTGQRGAAGCERVLSLGPSIVVCKKGAQGAEVFTVGRDHIAIAAKQAALVDPTGAGDVFAAGFLAGLLLNLDLERCAALGTEAAARSITGYGRSSYPGPELLASLGLAGPQPGQTAGGTR
jgi:ribokinase